MTLTYYSSYTAAIFRLENKVSIRKLLTFPTANQDTSDKVAKVKGKNRFFHLLLHRALL